MLWEYASVSQLDVLWESADDLGLSGLTPNYLRVRAGAPTDRSLTGTITATRLTAVENGALRGVPLQAGSRLSPRATDSA